MNETRSEKDFGEEGGGGGEAVSCNRLNVEAPPKQGTFFRLEGMYKGKDFTI